MLVECGFVRATTADGQVFTFSPSLGRVADLGTPTGIVELYAALHGPDAPREAAFVLAMLCDQDDPTPLIGWLEGDDWHDGAMPPGERVLIAQHLMQHAICGRAQPQASDPRDGGRWSPGFDAVEFIMLARVHLGLSAADAEALSMTELQRLLDVKFPKTGANVPTREQYTAALAHFDELARKRGAMPTPERES